MQSRNIEALDAIGLEDRWSGRVLENKCKGSAGGHAIELVVATKENTKDVGWFICDGDDAIDEECSIPFYQTVHEGANFSEADWKDQPCVRQAKIGWRDDLCISWMERHMEMTQGFLLVGRAPALMVLAPPTHDREDLSEEERRWPDRDQIRGYIIPPGCGIIIRKGTWHDFPVSVGPDVHVFVINTKEVVDALTSMKEPAPMDFGDCYKVRLSARFGKDALSFPDPRPFVSSLGLSVSSATLSDLSQDDDTQAQDDLDYPVGMVREEVGEWGGNHAGSVWVVPVVNVESFDSNAVGPSVQPHLNKTQPEVANRGWRDYGNRRGLKRLGAMFAKHCIPVTAVVSSDLAENHDVMSLLHQFKEEQQWEVGAHGANNSNAGHAGLSASEESERISSSLAQLGGVFGGKPSTWLTPGFSVTPSTPKLLSSAGVQTLLDFVDDDVPFKLVQSEPSDGEPLVCLPYSMETNDFSLILTRNLSPREYAAALESHILQLAEESRESGTATVVCLGMHTFVSGTPAAVHELDKVLTRLSAKGNVKWATAKEVTRCVRDGEAASSSEDAVFAPNGFPVEAAVSRLWAPRNADVMTSRLHWNHDGEEKKEDEDGGESNEEYGVCEEEGDVAAAELPPQPLAKKENQDDDSAKIRDAETAVTIDRHLHVTPSRQICKGATTAKLPIQVKRFGTLEVDRNKVGLLLIDFQNDFMSDQGFGAGLGNDTSKLHRAIRPTQDVLSSFRKAGLPVLHTREGHRSNLTDVTSLKAGGGELIGSRGRHGRSMIRGEWGNDIIPELYPLPDETVIDKPGKGAFYMTDLELVLRNANIDTLVVCGVTTEICVQSTVREANDRGIRCIVLDDCTASYFDDFHEASLQMISAQGGILGNVSDSESVLRGLN